MIQSPPSDAGEIHFPPVSFFSQNGWAFEKDRALPTALYTHRPPHVTHLFYTNAALFPIFTEMPLMDRALAFMTGGPSGSSDRDRTAGNRLGSNGWGHIGVRSPRRSPPCGEGRGGHSLRCVRTLDNRTVHLFLWPIRDIPCSAVLGSPRHPCTSQPPSRPI